MSIAQQMYSSNFPTQRAVAKAVAKVFPELDIILDYRGNTDATKTRYLKTYIHDKTGDFTFRGY